MYVQYVWNKKKPFGSSATAKISLEILKALGREKKTGYDTQKLTSLQQPNEMKLPECSCVRACVRVSSGVCVCVCERVGLFSCAYQNCRVSGMQLGIQISTTITHVHI